jgi:transcriptional regulator with XRE-family HTH domain
LYYAAQLAILAARRSYCDQVPKISTKEVRLVSEATTIYQETPDMDTMGGRLMRAREAAGLTVRELAWRLGVRIATVAEWENDRSQPSSHRLTTLAGLLKVSLSWLLHGVGTSPNEAEPSEMIDTMTEQVGRLRALHKETGALIVRMQNELDRLTARP